jgi:hypothetical protein
VHPLAQVLLMVEVEAENHQVVEDFLEVEVNCLEVEVNCLEVVGVALLGLNPYP